MKNKVFLTLILIITVAILYLVYRPLKIDNVYNGIYFDDNNSELTKQVKVSIVGTVNKNLKLQPESFIGTISIDSSTFEIFYPIRFENVIRNYRLPLIEYNINSTWRFHDESRLFEHLEGNVLWDIYVDRNMSNITFVPMIKGISSTERVTGPCDNREDAMKLTRMLNSGRSKLN